MPDSSDGLFAALEGRYHVERKLGEGGMATVYLAKDQKHHRNVALKVLKPELAAVVGAERFLAEIRTTANLQHPHILPLFDSGEAGSFLYYVMPYVEGESLRDRLDREHQLPVDEAVQIARDVAEALQAAHEQGVVHRDVKPANILLSKGRPLVSDFGIALALGAAGASRLTETGVSLGTPHYMAPEQATGDLNVGAAADIYALGCVLYEMLVGEPPHTGSNMQSILGKIVLHDADPVRTHRRSVPAHVDAAVGKALEKIPADRFAAAADFAAALRDPLFDVRKRALTAEESRAGRMGRTVWALVGALAVAIAAGVWGWLRPVAVGPVLRYPTTLAPGDTRDGETLLLTAALSPDGGVLVFRDPPVGPGQLYVKRRQDLGAQPLAGTEGGTGPFFSPDGAWIGYFAGNQLRRIPVGGGASLVLEDSVNIAYPGGAWLEDGTIVFHDWPDLRMLPAGGGPSEVVATADGLDGQLPWLPTPLPASRGVLFATCTSSGQSSCAAPRVYVFDTRTDSIRPVLDDAVAAWYVATGDLLYLTSTGALMAVPWDNDALTVSGPPAPVIDGIQTPGMVLSAEGTALYVLGPAIYQSSPAANAEVVWIDRDGRVEPVDTAWRFNMPELSGGQGLALSRDDRLAVTVRTDLGDDIWLRPLSGGPLSRLTLDDGMDRAPSWSQDGRSVFFLSARPIPQDTARRGFRLWRQASDGSGEPGLLWPDVVSYGLASPDGRWVVVVVDGGDPSRGSMDIRIARPEVDSVTRPLLATSFDEQDPSLSPDGRWIAYVSNETGVNEVFVRPFPDAEAGKWQVSSGGGTSPLWSRDGRELFFWGVNRSMNVVDIGGDPPTPAAPRMLFTAAATVRLDRPAITADGRFLAVKDVRPLATEARRELVLVQNFFAEVRAASAGRRRPAAPQ